MLSGRFRVPIAGSAIRLVLAVELEAPGLVVEFETLPPMTENPDWGIKLTRILLDAMEKSLDGLASTEGAFISQMMARVDTSRFVPGDYDLG